MNNACPICFSESSTTYYKSPPNDRGANVVKCSVCGHLYTKLTQPLDVALLYNDEVYKVVENRRSIFDKILTWEYARVLKRIRKFLSPPLTLLDFGSGKGKFGSLAQNDGWLVRGVETSLERATYSKSIYSLQVSTEAFTQGQIFESRFKIISLLHVLEHLQNPVSLLHELTQANLEENGILLIEVPNIKSWQAGLAGNQWMHLDIPRHISHFSTKKLRDLMTSLNFRPLRTSYFSFHLGVLGMVDSLLKLFGYKKNIILELKRNENKLRFVPIIFILPIAVVLEAMASLLGKGGIIRMYLVKT